MAKPKWPALKIEMRQVADLVPYARNARTHTPEQVAQIAASIMEFGWTTPALIDENDGIIAGHGRVLAAHQLKITEVPTVVARGWSEAQKRAYVIADNKLALNAGWDTELLKVELEELRGLDFNMDLLGFSADELDVLGNGWDSTIDPLEKHGENLDGIESTIKVSVEQDAAGRARDVIGEALRNAGITFELA